MGQDHGFKVGIMLYGTNGEARDAATEEKYRRLVEGMIREQFVVETLTYQASQKSGVRSAAMACDAVLVWINPTEPQLDRPELDAFLRELSDAGVLVSAHPDTILKIGTKDVLVESQALGWTVDACAYRDAVEFRGRLPGRVRAGETRVLKQHRGNGGQGVWKVSRGDAGRFVVLSASRGAHADLMDEAGLIAYFEREVFSVGSHLVDQAWVPTMSRGMVRAYLCGLRFAGFGYQEINALYPAQPDVDFTRRQPSRRHYYTEQCALFQPLRERLEHTWLPALAVRFAMSRDDFPLLWDADFFFGDPPRDYLLCEINVSCVSPFPESAITPLIRELKRRLGVR